MADQLNVLVICGSLRKGSYNAALTRALPGSGSTGNEIGDGADDRNAAPL